MNRPQNATIIKKYLDHYDHSPESKNMRKSSLRFFFGENFPIGNGKKNESWFNYENHVFDIDNEKYIEYFDHLKKLDCVSITTRINKWKIFVSFINYTMYIYRKYNFIIVKPPREFVSFENAKPKKNEVNSNRKVFATKEEIKKILDYFRMRNFKHYLIFRLFVETGIRKGELRNAKVREIYPEERFINTKKGKKDEKYYFFSEDLATLFKIYLNERKALSVNPQELFLTKHYKKYGDRAFNLILQYALDEKNLNIKKAITCHTFRRTINDLRKDMGCTNEDRKLLVGHKTTDVNVKSYTNSDFKKLRILSDKWNPYSELSF